MNKTCRLFFLLLLFASCFVGSLSAKETPEDSLRLLLAKTVDPQKRVEIAANLDDYCHYISKKGYPETAYLLLDESIKARNNYGITQALRGLIMRVDITDRVFTNDSIARYREIAEKHLTGEWKRCFLTEMRMRQVRSMADWSSDEEKATREIMQMYTATPPKNGDIYDQIEHEYALGKLTSTMRSNWMQNIRECLRYYDQMLVLVKELPMPYRANLLIYLSDNAFVAYSNAKEKKKVVETVEFMFETFNEYKQSDLSKMEKFENYDDIYYLYYEGIAISPEIVGKQKAEQCLKSAEALARKPDGFILSFYDTSKEHYRSLGNYKMAIEYIDSIIPAMLKSDYTEVQAVVSDLFREKAECYVMMDDYESAYNSLKNYDVIRDSSENNRMRATQQELRVQYDVNQLELETVRLESRNRHIALISVLIVLILSVAWGVHQWLNIKRLQKIQKRLVESNEEVKRQSLKAQESEKMKTVFINSMCHEIRTPLNAINGFSALLLDNSIDEDTRQEFPALIQQNTDQLTHLINDLLEVSNLDSSNDDLSLEPMDLCFLLKLETERFVSLKRKPGIDYRMELEAGEHIIHTHTMYLTRVVTNLLDNANKFTEQGTITVACQVAADGENMILSITDTGIGIPRDKQEWVFDRFTKMDEFKPGIGLGLYVCRLIVERLHGTIHIDPNYNKGTRFILTLPYK